MSEHAHKVHPVPAVIMVLLIAALVGFGISLMNEGHAVACTVAAVIAGLFGVFAVLVLGRE